MSKTKTKTRITPAFLFFFMFAIAGFNYSCGGEVKKDEAAIKEEMPAELKDTAALQKDEENALDKLNLITDTVSNK